MLASNLVTLQIEMQKCASMVADAYSSCTINDSPVYERKTWEKGMLGNIYMKTTWSRLRCETGQRKGNRQRMERAGDRRKTGLSGGKNAGMPDGRIEKLQQAT